MNMKRLLCWAFLVAVIASARSRYLNALDMNGFLDDDVDIESVCSDLPPSFNLAKASMDSFLELPFFTAESARTVIAARDSLSFSYVQSHIEDIPGLSPMEYAVLAYYTLPQMPLSIRDFSGSLRQGIIYNPEDATFPESRYYTRLEAQNGHRIRFTVLGERDPGEPEAFDLFSGSVELNLDQGRTRVVIGDFRPGFAQGLLFSRYGRVYGNGASILLRDPENVVNTSFEETRFLRGGYVSVKRKLFTVHAWTSVRRLDATLDGEGKAITIRDTGYHLAGSVHNNLTEKIHAARVVFTPYERLICAVAGVVSDYNPSLARKEGEEYYYDPEGSVFRHVSFDGSFSHGPGTVFGELVYMDGGEHAYIGGVTVTQKNIKSSVLFRHYSTGYWSLHSSGFSSFGNTSNEEGVYSALQAGLPFGARFLASMDLAGMLYRRKTSPLPESREKLNIVL
ncbi:hypothetical protein LLG96_03620, partial [bacterium]|nr:hypothetical protein [bacterium]